MALHLPHMLEKRTQSQVSVILCGWEQSCPVHQISNASGSLGAQENLKKKTCTPNEFNQHLRSLCHRVPPRPRGKSITASRTLLETEKKARRHEPWLLGVSHEVKTCWSGRVKTEMRFALQKSISLCIQVRVWPQSRSKDPLFENFDGLTAMNRRI